MGKYTQKQRAAIINKARMGIFGAIDCAGDDLDIEEFGKIDRFFQASREIAEYYHKKGYQIDEH
jgi:hypothetical protein